VLLLALAGLVATSLEGNSAFRELQRGAQESPTTTKTTTTASTTSTQSGTSRDVILLASGAAVLLLSGIGFVIVRDARRVAPASDLEAIERSSARDSAARLRNRRSKAKAARQQRKRNR
jgi:hypothetical protein